MNLKKILKAGILGIGIGVVGTAIYSIRPFDSPEWYQAEWESIKHCTGIEVKQPRYFKVKGDEFPCLSFPPNLKSFGFSKTCNGMYIFGGFILLSESAADNRNSVRHEMAHAHRIGWVDDDDAVKYAETCPLVLEHSNEKNNYVPFNRGIFGIE